MNLLYENNNLVASAVAHTCTLSFSGGGDWEDYGAKSARIKSSQDPISVSKKASFLACQLCGKHNRIVV
jgi:hypothetical protein